MLIRLVYSGELVSETYELVRHASNLDGRQSFVLHPILKEHFPV